MNYAAAVLVLGRRNGLEAVLRRRERPYALWLDREPGTAPRRPFVVAPFPGTKEAVAKVRGLLQDAVGPRSGAVFSETSRPRK